MNQKIKPSSSYSKQASLYSTSPRFPRRNPLCHKATSTIEKYPIQKACKDQLCQTDPVKEQSFLQRDYFEALRYINECHEMMNQMYQRTKANLRIPEVPNFIDMYMHCNNSKKSVDEIAIPNQQNISQTHCTLIDSPCDDSVNTNNNCQDYSSPESDYELLAEPLNTYNKKQGDIKRAKCHLNAGHVLQEDVEQQIHAKEQKKHLDVLYENNVNWRLSDQGRIGQQIQNRSNNQNRNKQQEKVEMSPSDFENIVEELAQHASQKYNKSCNKNNSLQPHSGDYKPRTVPPLICTLARDHSSYHKTETQESSDSPNDQVEQCETKPPQTFFLTDNSHQSYAHSNQYPINANSHSYEKPASKLLQRSHQFRTEQQHQQKPNANVNKTKILCPNDKMENTCNDRLPCYKTPIDNRPSNSFEKSVVCKKTQPKNNITKQYSDSDIDDEYFNENTMNQTNRNMQRSCTNTTEAEERRPVIRPNKTELISTVKYGRKVVMRTELPPSEHPNFRQQRQPDSQEGTKCDGDSSDISSDPEFLMRQ